MKSHRERLGLKLILKEYSIASLKNCEKNKCLGVIISLMPSDQKMDVLSPGPEYLSASIKYLLPLKVQ